MVVAGQSPPQADEGDCEGWMAFTAEVDAAHLMKVVVDYPPGSEDERVVLLDAKSGLLVGSCVVPPPRGEVASAVAAGNGTMEYRVAACMLRFLPARFGQKPKFMRGTNRFILPTTSQ